MGIKETVLGWLRSGDAKSEDLREAEIDEATREYSSDKADLIADERFGMRSGDFHDDQEAPRH